MSGDRLLLHISRVVVVAITAIYLSILFHIIIKGIDAIVSLGVSDIPPAIWGSLTLVFLSVTMAIPLGVSSAIYMELYGSPKIVEIFDISFEILASIPSIVIGLFGFATLIALHRYIPSFRASLLLASISLCILVLPYIVKATRLGFSETPSDHKAVAYSLGATKEDVLFRIMLPSARGQIKKGIFLAIARSAEDTAVIMLTGAVASYGFVDGLLSPFEALPFYIYYTSAVYSNPGELLSIYEAALILICLSAIFIRLSSGISRGGAK